MYLLHKKFLFSQKKLDKGHGWELHKEIQVTDKFRTF